MKKIGTILFVLVLVLSMVLLDKSSLVYASPKPTGLADGAWSTGTEVEIKLDATPGLQLLTNGVKISQPARLCHAFRGGDYGWVGEIRMLKNGVWVKQPTTQGWVPDTEGAYMACTDAKTAGTYALFGWFDAKNARASTLPICDGVLLNIAEFKLAQNFDQNNEIFYTTNLSFMVQSMGYTSMQMSIVQALDTGGALLNYDASSFDASGITDDKGNLTLSYLISKNEPGNFHVILTTPTCYFDINQFPIYNLNP